MSERIAYSSDGAPLDPRRIDENFQDMHPLFNPVQAVAESSRCLYCYDAPCVNACPTLIDIPKFIHQIRSENLSGSAKTILSANILGGTCARVCPTEELCEGACVKNAAGELPIAIGRLQRYAVDSFLDKAAVHPFKRGASTGQKVAVVGAGPAGLACAHRSAMAGHEVTVFDGKSRAGGLNEYGLAAYKMADDFAAREVNFLLGIGGIAIVTGKALGVDLSIESLSEDYDAVFLAMGLGSVNSMGIPGEDLEGVRDAINFIEELRKTEPKSGLNVPDSVVVIGGGNTAIDAAVQAKRLGSEEVNLVYRRGAEQMPATDWEQDLAKTNDVIVTYWAKPVSISGESRAESVSFEHTRLENGRLVGTGETHTVKADLILKAIGQKINTVDFEGLSIDSGKLKVGEDYMTSKPGVFAGGDCIDSGEDLTVQAVDDGQKAAAAINTYLREGK